MRNPVMRNSTLSTQDSMLFRKIFVMLILALLALGSALTSAQANRLLVDELRSLRASIPSQERVHHELTLRLADELMNEAFTGAQREKRGREDRNEALALYTEALKNIKNEAMKRKLHFQMARIHAENGDWKSARPIFTELSQSAEEPTLRLESLSRLSEVAEKDGNLDEAGKNYRKILGECKGMDLCTYVHYRLSWIERKNGNIPGAIAEAKLGLHDSQGQIREEALRDLIVFMGLDPARAAEHIAATDEMQKNFGRNNLLTDLSAAYFANGELAAGARVLELENSRAPSVVMQVKLLEAYLGAKDWESFRRVLGQFSTLVNAPGAMNEIRADSQLEKNFERVLKHMAIQLDGERKTDPTKTAELIAVTEGLLAGLPELKDRVQILEGWVAAQTDDSRRVEYLSTFLARSDLNPAERARLLELRVTSLQKLKDHPRVVADLDTLIALQAGTATAAKLREYRYIRARTTMDLDRKDEALASFRELADPKLAASGDEFALMSQNLALLILSEKKDFVGLIQQASIWTKDSAVASKYAKDVAEMKRMASEAEFEAAASKGSSAEALPTFLAFCREGRFVPKSCENAKVLAVQAGRHPELIEALSLLGAQDELLGEYEAGGYFAEAAKLMEKNAASKKAAKTSVEFKDQLRTAFFYELALDFASRDRSLREIVKTPRKTSLALIEQEALFVSLRDAKMIEAGLLKAALGETIEGRVANELQVQGKSTPASRAILLRSTASLGEGWEALVVDETLRLEASAEKIGFYGVGGEARFQRRVNAIKKLSETVDRYVSGADLKARLQLLASAWRAHVKMSEMILGAPIPAGLAEEDLAQVQAQLTQAAAPFDERGVGLKKLLDEQVAKLGSDTEKAAWNAWIEKKEIRLSDELNLGAAAAVQAVTDPNLALHRESIEALHRNPKERTALENLAKVFESMGLPRVAKYFEGRLKELAPAPAVAAPAAIGGQS